MDREVEIIRALAKAKSDGYGSGFIAGVLVMLLVTAIFNLFGWA